MPHPESFFFFFFGKKKLGDLRQLDYFLRLKNANCNIKKRDGVGNPLDILSTGNKDFRFYFHFYGWRTLEDR